MKRISLALLLLIIFLLAFVSTVDAKTKCRGCNKRETPTAIAIQNKIPSPTATVTPYPSGYCTNGVCPNYPDYKFPVTFTPSK